VDKQTLGKHIQTLRKQRLLTQDAFADRAKLSQSEVSKIEAGRFRTLSEDTINKLARALEVSPEVLIRSAISLENEPTGLNKTIQPSPNRRLIVFLCHSSGDKPAAQHLYNRLHADGVDPWLDVEKLLPGQDWELEIRKAVKNSDIIIICLSEHSINKKGFVQKEIKFALDVADEQPEGTIFLIPLRLEQCEVPDRLRSKHWVDYFRSDGYERLIHALRTRAQELEVKIPSNSSGRKKEQISTKGSNSRYVRRDEQGRFFESDDIRRSLEQDVNKHTPPVLLEHGSPKDKGKISLLIWITRTDQRYEFSVSLDATVAELKEYLIEELKIVRRFEDGTPIPYKINSKALGRRLNDSLTFRETGVPEMDTLTFHADIKAG
jgi:transcriptional regulator with XRE-family HTH domain